MEHLVSGHLLSGQAGHRVALRPADSTETIKSTTAYPTCRPRQLNMYDDSLHLSPVYDVPRYIKRPDSRRPICRLRIRRAPCSRVAFTSALVIPRLRALLRSVCSRRGGGTQYLRRRRYKNEKDSQPTRPEDPNTFVPKQKARLSLSLSLSLSASLVYAIESVF